MDTIKVVLADDDAGMRLVVRHILERVEGFTLVGEAADGDALLELVEKHHPQICFLDVEMPGKSGVECARIIQDMDPTMVLIFATAHDQYMGDAFEVYAFDYLIKPFKVERVMQTLERARDRLLRVDEKPLPSLAREPSRVASGRLMLKHREGLSFLDIPSILLIQREDRASVLYLTDGSRYVTGDSLSELEARLPSNLFFRCHKSYIVNLNHIDSISPYGRWTYIIRLRGTKQDALITHEKYEELERLFS